MKKIEGYQLGILISAFAFLILAMGIEERIETPETDTDFFSLETAVLLSKELAFALIISFVVSVGIERRARWLDNLSHEKMRKTIAEDVFRGVFAENLPRNYVDAVVKRDLRVDLVRPWIKTINDIVRLNEEEMAAATAAGMEAFRINRKITYELKNITGKDVESALRVYMPVAHPVFRDSVGVSRISMDGAEMETEHLKSYRRLEREGTTVCYEWPVLVRKGESLRVEIEGRLFKRPADNDIFGFHAPAFHYEVIVRSAFPLISLGLFERSAGTVTNEHIDLAKGFGMWVLEGPILPNDSITMWWLCDLSLDPGK